MPNLDPSGGPSGGYDFDAFFGAIAGQESGGNYKAVNGRTGALGRYQILPSNVPYWSQKYLGVKWTPQQFLSDPTKQEQLARAVLSDYFDRYGARGAAAAWYSGNPANANNYKRFNANEPSIGEYVDSVLRRAQMGGMSQSAGNPGRSADFTSTAVDNTVKDSQPSGPAYVDTQSPGVEAALPTYTDDKGVVHDTGADAVTAPGTQEASVGAAGAASVSQPVQAVTQAAPDPGYDQSQTPQAATPEQVLAHARELAINAARKMLGLPYVWGGGGAYGPSRSAIAHGNYNDVGFDCSGLVQYALAAAGIHAPRLSYDQLKLGSRTQVGSLQAGDLVGFGDGGHIALYLGGGQILEAPSTGKDVRVRSLGQGEDAWGVSLADLYK